MKAHNPQSRAPDARGSFPFATWVSCWFAATYSTYWQVVSYKPPGCARPHDDFVISADRLTQIPAFWVLTQVPYRLAKQEFRIITMRRHIANTSQVRTSQSLVTNCQCWASETATWRLEVLTGLPVRRNEVDIGGGVRSASRKPRHRTACRFAHLLVRFEKSDTWSAPPGIFMDC